MLFIAKNDDEKFYVNPEDAEKYAEQGYSIINENANHTLSKAEIKGLKAATIEEGD